MGSLLNELLISIGDYTQFNDFRALTLCSKKLRAVFLPFLFSSFLQRRSYVGLSLSYISMIIHIWQQPDLASQVCRFSLSWNCSEKSFENNNRLGDEFNGFVDRALDEIFEPEEQACRSRWPIHLQRQCEEAWKGLLLVRLTHLQTLDLISLYTEGLVPDILRKAALRQRPFHEAPPFPCLRNIQASPGLMEPAIGSRFILPFFYFPAVRIIEGVHYRWIRYHHTVCGLEIDATYRKSILETLLLPVNHSSRPVRKIILRTCHCNRGILGWLKACTQLEHVDILLFGPEASGTQTTRIPSAPQNSDKRYYHSKQLSGHFTWALIRS